MRGSHLAAALAALGYATLIVGQFAVLGPLFGVLLGLPLAWPMLGLLRRRRYTAAWASMLVLFYLGGWLIEYRGGLGAGLWLSVAALTAFCASLVYVKWAAVEDRAALAAQKGSTGADASR